MAEMSAGARLSIPDFQPPGSATITDFGRIDMRVERIVAAEPFPRARVPAYRLTIDFGHYGTRHSSARLPGTYPDPAELTPNRAIRSAEHDTPWGYQ